ncbi:MAG: twin-arginine translocation signal domain-containing protein, partial [Verrucomicrobiales bacterium]|nr:twin-arginine translocation signal domain-containing protein [Verrucomicrobiales bacterium]
MSQSRRHFFKRAAMAGASAVLGGCAAPTGNSRSYLTGVYQAGGVPAPDAFVTDVMFQAVRDLAIGPPVAARAYAFGHLAGFLAVNGFWKKYVGPYPEIGVAPSCASPEAAYVTAALRAAGEALQMPMGLDRDRYLRMLSDTGDSISRGKEWGKEVGRVVSKRRSVDGGHRQKIGFYFDPSYEPRKTIDSWSSTGPFYKAEIGPRFETFERGLFPNLGNMEPFAIRSKTQFAPPPFPDIRSKEFAQQYEEVYTLGGSDSTRRTDDQTEIAFFWEDGPRGGTVPGAWLHIAMRLALQNPKYTLLQRARFMALMSSAQADAALSA